MQNTKNTRPVSVTLLLVWQFIELTGMFLAIPFVFIFGVLFTGDSYTIFDCVTKNIIPVILLFFVLKTVFLFAMFKRKRWAVIANLVQNIFLVLLSIWLIIVAYKNVAPYFFFLLYSLLTVGYYYSAQTSYFKKSKHIDSFD